MYKFFYYNLIILICPHGAASYMNGLYSIICFMLVWILNLERYDVATKLGISVFKPSLVWFLNSCQNGSQTWHKCHFSCYFDLESWFQQMKFDHWFHFISIKRNEITDAKWAVRALLPTYFAHEIFMVFNYILPVGACRKIRLEP